MESKVLESFRGCLEYHIRDLQKKGLVDQYKRYLENPTREELPRMNLINVNDFYTSHSRQQLDYRPQTTFTRQRQEEAFEKLLSMQEILEREEQTSRKYFISSRRRRPQTRQIDHVTIVGPAGAGKTILLIRFARDAIDRKIPQLQDEDQIVLFISGRDFGATEKIRVADLLFKGMAREPSEQEQRVGFEWMLRNSEKVTIVIDSLDSMPYELSEEYENIRPGDEALPATILYNLFTGKIFPKCRILSSSREYKIRNYRGALRSDRIVSLSGFTKDSMKRLVHGFLGDEEGRGVWAILETKAQGLITLCRTPVFLVFTLVGMKQKGIEGEFLPSTMSGVMINLLDCLLHSEHARALGSRGEQYVISAINKMKQLAFYGMEKGKVLFTEEDLHNFNLTAEEIADLAVVIPGRVEIHQQLLEKSIITFFTHQSLQEVLCAMRLAEMNPASFQDFVSRCLHTPRFSVVRRMLCGVLLDPEVHTLATDQLLDVRANKETVCGILVESLRDELQSMRGRGVDQLELFHAIREAGNGAGDIVSVKFDEIDVHHTSLRESDMLSIGFLLARCRNMKSVDMRLCRLNPECIRILFDGVKDARLQIERLDVGGNHYMGVEGIRFLAEFVKTCGVRDFRIGACGLTFDEVDALNDVVGDIQMDRLDVGDNPDMTVEGLECVGNLVKRCGVGHLSAGTCRLSARHVQALERALVGANLTELDVSHNFLMEEEGLAALGSISQQCEVVKLRMERSRLKPEHVRAFNSGLGEATLEELDINETFAASYGYTPRYQPIAALCHLIPKITGRLDMRGCKMRETDESALQDCLDQLYPDVTVVIEFGSYNNPAKLTAKGTLWMRSGRKLNEITTYLPGSEEVRFKMTEYKEERFVEGITASGLIIELRGCKLSIPEGAFADTTAAMLRLIVYTFVTPSSYRWVTPVLDARFTRLVLKPILVEMETVCVADQSDKNPTAVDILHLSPGSDNWDIIHSAPLPHDGLLHFECNSFSPILAVWKKLQRFLFAPRHPIDGYLNADSIGNFQFTFRLNHPLITNYVDEKHPTKFTRFLTFDPMRIREDDTIVICFPWQGDNVTKEFKFIPESDLSFLFDEQFIEDAEKVTEDKVMEPLKQRGSSSSIILKCRYELRGNTKTRHFSYHYTRAKEGTSKTINNAIKYKFSGHAKGDISEKDGISEIVAGSSCTPSKHRRKRRRSVNSNTPRKRKEAIRRGNTETKARGKRPKFARKKESSDSE